MTHPLLAKFEALKEEARVAIKDEFKAFFAKHPLVSSIVWTQYAPYFNDGDACTFSVHEFTFKGSLAEGKKTLEESQEDEDDENYDEDDESDIRDSIIEASGRTWDHEKREYVYGTKRPLTREEESLIEDAEELEDLCQRLSEQMEDVFGGDARVVATANGFQVSEYSSHH